MTRRIRVGITIPHNHPLIELLGGIGPARTLLLSLGEATLRGLAHPDLRRRDESQRGHPELAEATRMLVAAVEIEAGDELDVASDLPITDETTALVLRLRARVAALTKVEVALRAVSTPPFPVGDLGG